MIFRRRRVTIRAIHLPFVFWIARLAALVDASAELLDMLPVHATLDAHVVGEPGRLSPISPGIELVRARSLMDSAEPDQDPGFAVPEDAIAPSAYPLEALPLTNAALCFQAADVASIGGTRDIATGDVEITFLPKDGLLFLEYGVGHDHGSQVNRYHTDLSGCPARPALIPLSRDRESGSSLSRPTFLCGNTGGSFFPSLKVTLLRQNGKG